MTLVSRIRSADLQESGPRLALACVLLLTLLVYCQVLTHGFIAYDDPAITENPLVRKGLTWHGALWAVTNTQYYDYWHPLPWLSHMLDFRVFGDDAGGHHLVSVVCHLLAAVVAYASLARLTQARWPAAGVAGLFALHPVHVESVAWLVERKDVLAGLMFFITLWLYAVYRERRSVARYLLLSGAYAIGLSAKPTLVTLPFVLLLLDYWLPSPAAGRAPGTARHWSVLTAEKIPLLLLAAAVAVLTYVVVSDKGALSGLTIGTFWSRLGIAFLSYAGYLRRLAIPVGLSVLYPRPQAVDLWQAVGAALLVLALTAGALGVRKRLPWVLTGWLWFLGTLVPVIGLVQTGMQSVADRFLYIPGVGIYVAAVYTVWSLLPRASAALQRAIVVVGCVVLLALALATHRQVGYWRTSETLFRRAIEVDDRCYPILNNLATLYMEQGRSGEAGGILRAAAEAAPEDWVTAGNLGAWYLQSGDTVSARHAFGRALVLNPDFAEGYLGLARISHGQGQDSLAADFVWTAARCQPVSSENWRKAASEMVTLGDLSSARMMYLRAAELAPEAWEPLAGLGQLELVQHNVGRSLVWYKAALELRPPVPDPYVDAGQAALRVGLTGEARQLFTRALAMEPGMCEAMAGMALTLHTAGNRDSASAYVRSLPPVGHGCPQLDYALELIQGYAGRHLPCEGEPDHELQP